MKLWNQQGRLAAALLVLATADAHAIEWFVDGELTATQDSNVSRAERERDIIADESVLAAAGVVLAAEPTFSTSLSLRGFAEAEAFNETDTLNRTTTGGQLTGRWQPTSGYRAPLLQAVFTGQVDDYDVTQRDSLVYSAQLFASQRANDRIMLSYGVEAVERRSDGTVFDTTHGRAFISADFELDPKWNAYSSFSHLRGDTFSSAQFSFCNGAVANDIFGLINASEALESDVAFNEVYCGSWITYRIKAVTNALTVGLNHGFNHSLSADISVQGVQVMGKGDNDYDRVLVRAGLLARF
ncbi:MAG: hypothetical protein K0S46_1333 [Moraxellaceae bacterium]|jgi:hypothetical protein|nr:hypothetical protein [Moraxellaceae bacterium]